MKSLKDMPKNTPLKNQGVVLFPKTEGGCWMHGRIVQVVDGVPKIELSNGEFVYGNNVKWEKLCG